MPSGRPRGRPAGSTNNKTPQQRLSFGPNAANKITKPSPLSQSHTKKPSPTTKSALASTVSAGIERPKSEAETPTESTSPSPRPEEEKSLPIRRPQAPAAPAPEKKDVKEDAALKVSEAQIRKYWKLKEEARIAPRVHQKGLGVHEKVLREFDLSSQFGPCIGIPRLKRWKRADGLGLKPPLEVLTVLLRDEGMERAYVDQLMGGHLDGVEL